MFKKKEQKSVVEQLKGELGTGFERTYMGMMFGYDGLDEDTGERREDFVEILEPFIEDKLEKDYVECEDCGCLVAKDKALVVKERVTGSGYGEKVGALHYCKHCKPPYDEILKEWDENEEKEVITGYVKNGVSCNENGKILK